MTREDTRTFLTVLLLLLVAALGALFLYWIGIDALEGRSTFQFYADSATYHAMARGDYSGVTELGNAVTVAGNYLGPVVLVRLLGENYYVIMLFNVMLLYFATTTIARSLKLDVFAFTLLLLVDPLTISSLLSVNKEIVSLLSLALLIRAYKAHSVFAFVGALLTSVLVRWQLTLFLLTLAVVLSGLNPLRRHRLAVVFGMLVGISVLFVALAVVFQSVVESAAESFDDASGSGFFELLTNVQNRGGYLLIFPIKAADLMFAMGLRLDRLLAPRDIYNDIWQLLHSTISLVIFIVLLRKRRFSLRNDLIYVSVIYLVVFAISPIHSSRYFYIVYVLWAAALVGRAPGVQFIGSRAGFRRRRPARPAPALPVPTGPGEAAGGSIGELAPRL